MVPFLDDVELSEGYNASKRRHSTGSHGSHLIDRARQLAYIATFTGAHMILGMCTLTRTLIFSLPFLSFQNVSGSKNFILFKNFLLYI